MGSGTGLRPSPLSGDDAHHHHHHLISLNRSQPFHNDLTSIILHKMATWDTVCKICNGAAILNTLS